MSRKLALIHTGTFLVPLFMKLCQEIMPTVEVFNIVDESLIKNTIAANELTPGTSWRLAQYIKSAEDGGADAILVTCSSMGPAVEAARPFTTVPVLRVDQPMVDEAIHIAQTIGVIATLSTTLGPTVKLINDRAAEHGKEVKIVQQLCKDAFEAVSSGDVKTHDQIVSARIREMLNNVDVVVLAQASMAQVADSIPESERCVPVLSSPRLGVQAAKKVLDELAATTAI